MCLTTGLSLSEIFDMGELDFLGYSLLEIKHYYNNNEAGLGGPWWCLADSHTAHSHSIP